MQSRSNDDMRRQSSHVSYIAYRFNVICEKSKLATSIQIYVNLLISKIMLILKY